MSIMTNLDFLTSLLTRSDTLSELDELILEESSEPIAVVLLDIGRFRIVNDSVGIQVGDRIIKLIAKRIQKAAPEACVVGRTSGDNFALAFKGLTCKQIEEILDRLLDFCKRPLAVGGKIIVISISIGWAIAQSSEGTDGSSLFHAADVALHYAQNNGFETAQFAPEMLDAAQAAHTVENDLRVSVVTQTPELYKAIATEQFSIHYQPIVSGSDFSLLGFEALLRWNHPDRGAVSPVQFIPIAEEIGVIDLLGAWGMRKACKDMMQWQSSLPKDKLFLNVNISAKQFNEPTLLISTIEQSLDESGLAPHCLKLEITETSTLAERPEVFWKIKEIGCLLSLDDFGTGYSSLTYLHSLPFDEVKIDKSFVSNLDSDNQELQSAAEKMVRAVYGLCKAIDLDVVVEGIETKAQLDFIRRLGYPMYQGYLFGKPMPGDRISEFLSDSGEQVVSFQPGNPMLQ